MSKPKEQAISIVGGGFSGALLALKLLERKDKPKLNVFEKNREVVPDRVISFHGTDISQLELKWITPYLRNNWNAQEVRLGNERRILHTPYYSIDSAKLRKQTVTSLKENLHTGNSSRIHSETVIFSTGYTSKDNCGWQKFLGLEFELKKPHGLHWPIIMDARCEQTDGFRFIYVLPWNETSLLIEDTHYSDHPEIDENHYASEIYRYAKREGYEIKNEIRREMGALPIPFSLPTPPSLSIGALGGFFHPLTGYSVPFSLELSTRISALPQLNSHSIEQTLSNYRKELHDSQIFSLLLSNLLFKAAKPEDRHLVFEKFYRNPQDLLERFYSLKITKKDKLKIFTGKPPVPVFKAMKIIKETLWT